MGERKASMQLLIVGGKSSVDSIAKKNVLLPSALTENLTGRALNIVMKGILIVKT